MSQPIETFAPELAAIAAPVASEMNPVTATRLPMPILVISGGSRNFFAQSRQKITVSARKLTDTIESSVTSHVVGIFLPKKMSFAVRETRLGAVFLFLHNGRVLGKPFAAGEVNRQTDQHADARGAKSVLPTV